MTRQLILIAFFIPSCLAGCPPGYEIINNICFGLKTGPNMDYDEADKLCHADHTRLARVEPDHMKSLLKVLPRGARAWIGLRFDKAKLKWIWAKDQSSADMKLPYLGNLDLNATVEDDCGVIRMKKNVLSIEGDTCTDKWITSALCSMEKESCGYSMTQDFGDCEFDDEANPNRTCSKNSYYDVDGGALPRHLNSCQVDGLDCRVVLNGTYTDGVSCSLSCGDNVAVGANETIGMSDDCKRVVFSESCNCEEAAKALAQGSHSHNRLGLYIGVSVLAVVVAVLVVGAVAHYLYKRRKQHTERIHPPQVQPSARYTVDPVRYRGGTAPY